MIREETNTQATRAHTHTHTHTQTNEEKEKTGKQNEKQNQELPKGNITATALQAAHLSATKQTAGKVHRCNRRSSSDRRQTANLAPALLVRIMASNSRTLYSQWNNTSSNCHTALCIALLPIFRVWQEPLYLVPVTAIILGTYLSHPVPVTELVGQKKENFFNYNF
jgi:hypothetical protein